MSNKEKYFCRCFINELYILLGMSAESFDKCAMGEYLMVKQSCHLKKQIVPLLFLFHTHQLNTLHLKTHPFMIPINLSLLNRSNLFL